MNTLEKINFLNEQDRMKSFKRVPSKKKNNPRTDAFKINDYKNAKNNKGNKKGHSKKNKSLFEPATTKQIWFLRKNGIDFKSNITKIEAMNLISLKKNHQPLPTVVKIIVPASLPLKRFLESKQMPFSNGISRDEAVDMISLLGFSVDNQDRITKDD